jgi:hypothetical protein
MNEHHILFHEGDLYAFLAERRQRAVSEVDRLTTQQLLGTEKSQLVSEVVSRFSLTTPTLGTPGKDHEGETQVTVHDPFSGQVRQPGYSVTMAVPFTGSGDLFRFRPSRWSTSFPEGRVEAGRLLLAYSWPVNNPPSDLKARIATDIETIKTWLVNVASDAEAYNKELPPVVAAAVDRRLATIKQGRDLTSDL